MMNKKLIVILGPTASGKTHRAVSLARTIDGEIISADSRQVYSGMDIGTGKDIDEYGDVPYHLIDICPAGYKYNLYEYLRDFDHVFADIKKRGKNAILCGGTGLYIESVLNGLKLPEVPENKELRDELSAYSLEELTKMLAAMKSMHNTTDVDNKKRAIRAIEIQTYYNAHPQAAAAAQPHPISDALIIGIDIDREVRRQRISHRLDARLLAGMVNEIQELIRLGVKPEDLSYYGLEYKFVTAYVTGNISKEEMHDMLEIAIHQFAKRQMTWFRGMERRGFKINWLPYNLSDEEFNKTVLKMI
ncbi:MAG: tRNA (adenosine(37)-N6)-dimethylallyltransferase MiaA [Candidatus Limisoma sp.]